MVSGAKCCTGIEQIEGRRHTYLEHIFDPEEQEQI